VIAKLEIRKSKFATTRCYPEWSWAYGPPIEIKVIGFVTPAEAGVYVPTNWIPAFAGMT
jgi:hypothetical protein